MPNRQQPFRPEEEYGTKRRFDVELSGELSEIRKDFKIPSPKIFYDLIRDIDDTSTTVILPNGEEYSPKDLFGEVMPVKKLTPEFCNAMSQWILNHSGYSNTIFGTIHGSFLYGTAREDSDINTFIIHVNDDSTVQVDSIEDEMEVDVEGVSLAKFIEGLEEGNIKYVEALYSPYASFSDDEIHKQLMSVEIGKEKFSTQAIEKATEMRSIAENEQDDSNALKYLRHAKRLEAAAQTMHDGQYTPVWKPLSPEENTQN